LESAKTQSLPKSIAHGKGIVRGKVLSEYTTFRVWNGKRLQGEKVACTIY
jgi:hypothetical protein